ncbi:hypothetical protein [Halalkalicoccus subterraneus]|uniref:hypothetical protein n=1 Tax=Halalkalicoccus subterraneus TaxID=2675002 RepID=UPI0013CEF86B|nr:hypothetical protein [Halalkalicoccus subterraneus]
MSDIRTCTEDGCQRSGSVRCHISWADEHVVCTAHARTRSTGGVVAEPLADAEWE